MDILEILEEALAVGPWDKPIVTTVKFGGGGVTFRVHSRILFP